MDLGLSRDMFDSFLKYQAHHRWRQFERLQSTYGFTIVDGDQPAGEDDIKRNCAARSSTCWPEVTRDSIRSNCPEPAQPMAEATTKSEYVIGVDFGGTKIFAGVFTRSSSASGDAKISTKADRGVEPVIERIARCVRDAVDEATCR